MNISKKFYIPVVIAALTLGACGEDQETPAEEGAEPTGEVIVQPGGDANTTLQSTISTGGNAATGGSTAGLNPAHGEPGHRCDIEVGVPLDSPPTIGTGAPSSSPVISNTLSTTSSGASSDGAVSGNTGKPNPAHGEPGHDCAVPVGQPLPAK